MKRNIKCLIVGLIIIAYIFLYRFFIYTNLLKYNESISASFMILLTTLSVILYGFRKSINSYLNKRIIKNTIYYIIKYFIIIYVIGILVGFLSNSYSLKLTGILDNIIPLIILIIFTELFRYTFIRANKDKKIYLIIITILLSILEINFSIRYDSFGSIEQIFKFSTITILPIIMKNILCSYMIYQNDYKASIIYRLVIETYIYYVPIMPDLNDYMLSISNLLLPFLVFLKSIKIVDESNNYIKPITKKIFKIRDLPILIILLIIMFMVIGIGPIKILGIKTPSMTPAINVGDAVIIDKTYDVSKLKVNDVIAYKDKNDVIIIHRIIHINKDNSFVTKGDNNNTSDSVYVTKNMIVGKVVLTIPYIAYPAVFFRGE